MNKKERIERNLKIAEMLGAGEKTKDIAREFKMTASRIYQIKAQYDLEKKWNWGKVNRLISAKNSGASHEEMAKMFNTNIFKVAYEIGYFEKQAIEISEMIEAKKTRFFAAKRYGVSTSTLDRRCDALKLSFDIRHLTENDKNFIRANYLAMPVSEIAERLQFSTITVYEWVRKLRLDSEEHRKTAGFPGTGLTVQEMDTIDQRKLDRKRALYWKKKFYNKYDDKAYGFADNGINTDKKYLYREVCRNEAERQNKEFRTLDKYIIVREGNNKRVTTMTKDEMKTLRSIRLDVPGKNKAIAINLDQF